MGFMIKKLYEKHLTPGRHPVQKISQSNKTGSLFVTVIADFTEMVSNVCLKSMSVPMAPTNVVPTENAVTPLPGIHVPVILVLQEVVTIVTNR